MNCPICARPIDANELTWPADDQTGDVCQDCWEADPLDILVLPDADTEPACGSTATTEDAQ